MVPPRSPAYFQGPMYHWGSYRLRSRLELCPAELTGDALQRALSSQLCYKVGNYYCLQSTGGKNKVQCLICPKLCRIPCATHELRSLLTLIAVSQENKVLLSVNVLYCVWGGQGSYKICVFIKRGEKPHLGLPSLPISEQGLVFLNKKPKQNEKLSRVTLYFFFGLASIAFMFSFFLITLIILIITVPFLLILISFIYETCMNQQCDSRRLLLSCADVNFIL